MTQYELRFYFELAEKFHCTVNELLERMESYEITEWIAYYKIKEEERKKAEKKAESKAKARGKGRRR